MAWVDKVAHGAFDPGFFRHVRFWDGRLQCVLSDMLWSVDMPGRRRLGASASLTQTPINECHETEAQQTTNSFFKKKSIPPKSRS